MEQTTLRERQKERRRSRIYQVAIDLFKNQGFAQTTANDIAKAAHVSRGTFFNYYPYKEAVLLDYGAEIVDALTDEAEKKYTLGCSPEQVLYHLFDRLAEIVTQEKDIVPPMVHELLNPDLERAQAAYQALPLARLLERYLLPLKALGKLREDVSIERMGNMLADAYMIIALRYSTLNPARDIKQTLRKSLSVILEGIYQR